MRRVNIRADALHHEDPGVASTAMPEVARLHTLRCPLPPSTARTGVFSQRPPSWCAVWHSGCAGCTRSATAASPWKDASWQSRAPVSHVPHTAEGSGIPGHRPGPRSPRSESRWRCRTSSRCRPSPSTGWSATTPGGPESPATSGAQSGLEEILTELSPIEDFSGSMSLSFSNPRFEDVKASIEECKDKDMTYAAPLFVTAEFTNNTTGEIKSQTVFMGDFPMMTRKGTFIINGTERVVVSQLVRSPGRLLRPDAGQDLRRRRLRRQGHPEPRRVARVRRRQAPDRRRPHRPQAPPAGHRAAQGARLDRATASASTSPGPRRCSPPSRRTTSPPPTRRCSTSTASCARASRRRASPRRRCSRTCSSTRSATTWPRSAATRSTRSSASTSPIADGHAHRGRHRPHHRVPDPPARRRGGLRDRRHRPLRQPAPAHGRRADPEPDPGRPVPHGARRPRADDHPGRRGDHAADPDQHPAGRRLHQGVLRHVAAVAVHGPDQPAGRPDPQAPAVRARPGRPVPRPRRHGGPRRPPVATTAGCARSRRRKARTSA